MKTKSIQILFCAVSCLLLLLLPIGGYLFFDGPELERNSKLPDMVKSIYLGPNPLVVDGFTGQMIANAPSKEYYFEMAPKAIKTYIYYTYSPTGMGIGSIKAALDIPGQKALLGYTYSVKSEKNFIMDRIQLNHKSSEVEFIYRRELTGFGFFTIGLLWASIIGFVEFVWIVVKRPDFYYGAKCKQKVRELFENSQSNQSVQ